jgi:serine phosphatase RsbU (regulator of sigma subunit)
MRIRTQLILAAFVLAVVPLAAIVTYSHHTSRRALESAYRREAERLTGQMDKRLAAIRADLDRRLLFASALPLTNQTTGDVGSLVTVMGDSASLVDALEYQPVPAPEPAPRPASVEVAASEAPQDAPPPPAVPLVIDLPSIPDFPRFVISEAHQELISEVSRLGVELANRDLPEAERADLRAEMKKAQEELRDAVAKDRQQFDTQMAAARQALRERERMQRERSAPAPVPATAAVAAPAVTPKVAETPQVAATPKRTVVIRQVTPGDVEKSVASAKRTSLIFGKKFAAPVRQEGEVVGQLTARISPDQVIHRVLGGATEDRSEIPFAIDREGTLYTRNDDERVQLDRLGILERARKGRVRGIDGWIVSMSTDSESGLRIGVARPVGENFDELRRTAGRNFGLGLGLIAFAMIGIVPLSNHLARDVKLVTDGADRIAHGDLMTRLPVKTNNELGQLARAFNRMAEDLSLQQQKLVEQERSRKEQEIQQRLLAVEYERKTVELEDARRFQLSMLPKEVPQHEGYDVAVFTRTATEVGGDYYDFHLAGDVLSVTIGDATGHGAKAGTMVTVIKTLFAAYDGRTTPAEFLGDAAETIKRMDLGRMAMALSLARFDRHRLTISSAGMPPVLVHRAGQVDEIALGATPLGTLGIDYQQSEVELRSGDTVLFLSDGFPELMNESGQQLGYPAALDVFASVASAPTAKDVIASLAEEARRWHGDTPPNDDVTFVVVRVS